MNPWLDQVKSARREAYGQTAGNYGPAFHDNETVDCLTCREALSARIDGETEPVPADRTDEHLRTCAACQVWQVRVSEQARSLRVRAAVEVPDLSRVILENAVVPASARGSWARVALAGVSVAQLALGLAQLLGGGTTAAHAVHDGPSVASHLFNESTAWNVALGIGLFWAAFRPRATSGLIPVTAGFVVLVFAYSTHDLITDSVPVSRVVGHGLLVAGLCLMIVVNRVCGEPTPEGADGAGTESRRATSSDEPAESPVPVDGSQSSRRPHLRPASRHRAA